MFFRITVLRVIITNNFVESYVNHTLSLLYEMKLSKNYQIAFASCLCENMKKNSAIRCLCRVLDRFLSQTIQTMKLQMTPRMSIFCWPRLSGFFRVKNILRLSFVLLQMRNPEKRVSRYWRLCDTSFWSTVVYNDSFISCNVLRRSASREYCQDSPINWDLFSIDVIDMRTVNYSFTKPS